MIQRTTFAILLLCFVGMMIEIGPHGASTFVGRKNTIRVGIAGWQRNELPWEEIASAYSRKHGVDIEISMVPVGSETSLLFYWSNGVTPFDVICSLADEEIHPYIRKGLIVDFRKHLSQAQIEDFVPASLIGSSLVNKDGSLGTYCLPYQCEFMVMNYRCDILDKFGFGNPPASWDEVAIISEKIKGYRESGMEVAPICMDFTPRVFFAQNCFIPMLAELKGDGIVDDRGRLDIYGPEAKEIFVKLKDWYARGIISSTAFEGRQENEFLGGMGVFFCHWQTRGKKAMDRIEGGEQKISFSPVPGSSRGGALVSCYGAIIPKCSPVVDEAVKFCYEALSSEMQAAVAKEGTLPSLRSMYQPGKVEPWMLGIYGLLEKGYGFPDPERWPQVRMILGQAFGKYANDQMNVDDSMAWAIKEVEELYNKSGDGR